MSLSRRASEQRKRVITSAPWACCLRDIDGKGVERPGSLSFFDEASCHEVVGVQFDGVVEHFELHWLVELA